MVAQTDSAKNPWTKQVYKGTPMDATASVAATKRAREDSNNEEPVKRQAVQGVQLSKTTPGRRPTFKPQPNSTTLRKPQASAPT
ncbi:hypothetical protein MRX96_031439 [Rhipicephalus microplus]